AVQGTEHKTDQRGEPRIGRRRSCKPLVWARTQLALLFPQVLRKVPMHISIRCIYAYRNTREANDGNEASDYGRHWGNWWRGRAALAARGCFRPRSGAPRG